MAYSFGIYDGTDDEPEDERLAREAREAAEEEARLAEEERLKKLRDAGKDDPLVMDAFNVPTNKVAGDNSSGDSNSDDLFGLGFNALNRMDNTFDQYTSGAGGGSGSVAKPGIIPIGDPSRIITVPNDPNVVGTPAFEAREKAEYEAREKAELDRKMEEEIAEMLRKGRPAPISIGNPIDAIGAAATGLGQIIRDPQTGISNVITNAGAGIFGTGNSNVTISPLPVDPITGLVLTGAALANATAATRARDAAAAAAAGKAAGVSPEEQAELDAAAAAAAAAPTQGGAGAVAIGAGAAAAGSGGSSSAATQGERPACQWALTFSELGQPEPK